MTLLQRLFKIGLDISLRAAQFDEELSLGNPRVYYSLLSAFIQYII